MRRLLQFATIVLLSAGFIAPFVEVFDTWDPQGLGDDTEFGVFALILVLTFLLCVCELISAAALRFVFTTSMSRYEDRSKSARDRDAFCSFAISLSHSPPPLRI
jgi:hypothetical protein